MKAIHSSRKAIRVECPHCHKTGVIHAEEFFLQEAISHHEDLMMPLNVSSGDICEHEFTISIDADFKVR